MNIYDHPDYPDSPQMENDSFELGKLWEVPEYPYHYLMVEKNAKFNYTTTGVGQNGQTFEGIHCCTLGDH